MDTKILLADAHRLFRCALRRLLEAEPGLEVVAEASDGREALDLLESTPANLLISEVVMPRVNGIEVVRLALEQRGDCRALMLSGRSDSHCVGQALEAGASGFLTKSCSYEQLLDAIEAVRHGRTYLGSDVADVIVQHYVRHNGADNGNGTNGTNGANGNGHAGGRSLTRREREVLQLLAEGYATKQIAAELQVSIKTIDTHRGAVMRKLEIDNLAHLTKYAIRQGITSLDQ